jgi:hypothetical protein
MVAKNGISYNLASGGTNTREGYLHNADGYLLENAADYPPCASDYEERPVFDVVPTMPRPGWTDAFPAFTHNLSWIDGEGCSHSMTLRSDSLSGLMGDLKLLKGMIRKAKTKAAESQPAQTAPQPDSDVSPCKIHGMAMERRTSKRTDGVYFSHRLPGSKELCFGRERSKA